MQNKFSDINSNGLTGKGKFSRRGPIISTKRSILLGTATSILLIILMGSIIYRQYNDEKEDQKKEAEGFAKEAREIIETSFYDGISAAKTLSFSIQKDGSIKNFDSIAAQILEVNRNIDGVNLSPGGVTRYVYPISEIKELIGYDLMQYPLKNKDARESIRKKELFFSGPIHLSKGDIAVIGNYPIFREGRFWGFTGFTLRIKTLLKLAGIESFSKNGYYIQLSKTDPFTKQEEFFGPYRGNRSASQPILVDVPNGKWNLYAVPDRSLKDYSTIALLSIFGLLLSILGGVFVFSESGRPKKLNELITERTRQLRESEEKFSKAFQLNAVGFAIYDKDFHIVDLNENYLKIVGSNRANSIGKSAEEAGLLSRMNPAKRSVINQKIDELLESQGRVQNYELELDLINGKPATVLVSIEKIELNNKPHWLTAFTDITGIKEAELLMKESEVKYRSLIEQASDGIIITDLGGYILEANRSITVMSGYPVEELIGKHFTQFIPEEDLNDFPSRTREVIAGKNLLIQRRLQKKDGSILDVEVNSKMTSSNTLIGFLRDISDRKIAEEALKLSEEKYRTLFEQASDGIFIADKNGRFVVVNPSGCELTQFSESELLNMNITDFVLEEDLKNDPFHFHEMINNGVARTERRMKRKDGMILEIEVTAKFISSNLFLSFIRDITVKKKNDNLLRYQARTLEVVSDAITTLDVDRKIITWNLACEELYGYKKEEAIGKRVPELVTFEYPNSSNEEVFKIVFREGRWKGEFHFFHPKTQKKIFLLSSINLLKNVDGKIIGFIITSNDISDRKKTEEEKTISNERFELISQATNDIVWDLNLTGNEMWANKKMFDLLGIHDPGEKINYDLFIEHIHPDERDRINNWLQEAFKKSISSGSYELRVRNADGIYRNFLERILIKYNANGSPVRMLGAMQDITDKELIRMQILKEKELSDSIINSLPGIFYLFNKEGKFLRWNRNFEITSGYSAEEIGRMHPLDLFEKNDHELIAHKIENVFLMGEDNVEASLLRKNKQKLPYYFTGMSIKYEGEDCLMGVGLDFSDMERAQNSIRESEARYKSLVENATEALVVIDINKMKFVNVSESALKLFRMTREELLDVGFNELSPEFQPDGKLSSKVCSQKLSEAIRGQKPFFEWTHQDKFGKLIPCEVWLVQLPSETEILVRGSIVDISERKKTEEEIKANSELLRELYAYLQNIREEERTRIAREIHDELGQQLTGLKMDMVWVNRQIKSSDPEVAEKLNSTIELIDTTITTVRKIATQLRPSILDDLGLAAALEWQGEEFEKRSNIKVLFLSSIDISIIMPEISTGLFRIYQELLTNVARHSKATVVKTSIYLKDEKLLLEVIDNGLGFNEENIINKKTLGLRGIKERTSLIGGIYEINSSAGIGTSVTISVPLHRDTIVIN